MEKQPIISSTPKHYQGTIQPIDLINAQNLNFNLGNFVNYIIISRFCTNDYWYINRND